MPESLIGQIYLYVTFTLIILSLLIGVIGSAATGNGTFFAGGIMMVGASFIWPIWLLIIIAVLFGTLSGLRGVD